MPNRENYKIITSDCLLYILFIGTENITKILILLATFFAVCHSIELLQFISRMSAPYFYLVVHLKEVVESRASGRRSIEKCVEAVFGEVGAASVLVDVLSCEPNGQGSRLLLRVLARELRRLRAALALHPTAPVVVKEAPSLQALV